MTNLEMKSLKDPTKDRPSSRAKNVALWTLQILTAVAFLMAGFATLSGHPMMVATFDKIGIGQWFRYMTGGIEVTSAILLLIPRLTPVGAALLVCTMLGAVLSHLFLIGGSPVPALVLLCFASIILLGRVDALKSLLSRITAFDPRASESGKTVTSPSSAQ